jgi:hypothetical protein
VREMLAEGGVGGKKRRCNAAHRDKPLRVREAELSGAGPDLFLIVQKILC